MLIFRKPESQRDVTRLHCRPTQHGNQRDAQSQKGHFFYSQEKSKRAEWKVMNILEWSERSTNKK